MLNDEAKFLKKHIKTGAIDVHPTEKALIVNYEMEATILGEEGDPMFGEKKACQKIIRLKDLSDQTDVSALARELIDKCKLIPPNKIPEVEQLLYYLQNRRDANGTFSTTPLKNKKSNLTENPSTSDFNSIGGELSERANIHSLDKYIELIYEDVVEKIRGTSLILQLARNPDNLEELLQNETLLGALARVLREEWKKSMELATNIVYTFFCFSTFSQFHTMTSHFKVGAMCMQIIEHEIKRYEAWREDLQQKSKLNDVSKEVEKSQKKIQLLVKKQEQLLRVCIYLLLNLAEDKSTEAKMVNRGIVEMLCQLLDRPESADLFILVVTFLRKLSVYKENVSKMAKQKVIEKLSKVLSTLKNDDFVNVSLRLLVNLSFDNDCRNKICASNLIPLVVPYVGNPSHRIVALSLLYHISMDDQCKSMFTYTDCISLCMRFLFESTGGQPQIELLALLINLALNKRNAQLIAGEKGQGLKLLTETAFQQQNSMLMKLLRNIAGHDGEMRNYFVEYVGDLANAVKLIDRNKVDFGIECLGILNQLAIAELDFAALLNEFKLVDWIISKLQSGTTDDDIVLEVIVLLGTVAGDPNGAQLLMQSGIVDRLINILSAKQEDDEIVLQIVYVFYQMMFHESLRKKLLSESQVPAYLIELMHDKNAQIRKMCDNTLDVIAEHGDEWAKKIQEEKFRWHNTQWLEMVVGSGGQNGHANSVGGGMPNDNYAIDQEDDDDDDDFLNDDDLFNKSDLFNDMYGVATDDIVNAYDSDDRPFSRIGHRNNNARVVAPASSNNRPPPAVYNNDESDEDDDSIATGRAVRHR